MRLRPLVAPVSIALCVLLVGCTPATRGAVGVTLLEGVPAAVFAPCEGNLGTVVLSRFDHEGTSERRVVSWTLDADAGLTPLDLGDHLQRWPDDRLFELTAWAHHPGSFWMDERKRLDHVVFTPADIARLNDGDVLYTAVDTFDDHVSGSLEDFEAAACAAD